MCAAAAGAQAVQAVDEGGNELDVAGGGGAHSPNEYLEVASIERSAIRAAILIYRLTRQD
jgi:glutamate carboxypeptidase